MARIDPRLFRAVYTVVSRGVTDGSAPTLLIQAGQRIVRATRRQFAIDDDQQPSLQKLRECLIVRDGRSEGPDANRFSGRAPDGSVNVGAVYFSMHNEPMFMEIGHYSGRKQLTRVLKERTVLNVEVLSPLLVIDMSRHSAAARQYLRQVASAPEVRDAVGGRSVSLWDMMLADRDYTVSRAIGLAAGRSPMIDGLMAQTARTDEENRSGDNLILFGKPGQLVSAKLRIRSAFLFRLGAGPASPKRIDF